MRSLVSLQAWGDRGVEALLRVAFAQQPVQEPAWPLPPDLRSRVTVGWPKAYQWAPLAKSADQIRQMLARRVSVAAADIPQPFKGTAVCEFRIDGRRHGVAFNLSDYPDFIDERCVDENVLTFKFQFAETGYDDARLRPGGYLPASPVLYAMLPYLRWSKDARSSTYDVYGRFSMEFAQGIRGDTLRALAGSPAIQFYGGQYRVRYSRYLREMARARVCIDLPGQGPLCHRFVEYLAVGACVVARPHGVRLLSPLVEGTDVVYAHTPAEAVEQSHALVDDPDRQHRMSAAARAFFDRYLHRDQLSAYYLSSVLTAVRAV